MSTWRLSRKSAARGCVYFCNLSAVTPPEHVEIAVEAALSFRAGDRPWQGLRTRRNGRGPGGGRQGCGAERRCRPDRRRCDGAGLGRRPAARRDLRCGAGPRRWVDRRAGDQGTGEGDAGPRAPRRCPDRGHGRGWRGVFQGHDLRAGDADGGTRHEGRLGNPAAGPDPDRRAAQGAWSCWPRSRATCTTSARTWSA